MLKSFKLKFFGKTEESTGIVNKSERIIDRRTLNDRLLNEMLIEMLGED